MFYIQILIALLSLLASASFAAHAPYIVLKKENFKDQLSTHLDRDLRVEEQQCWVYLMGDTTESSKETQNKEFFDVCHTASAAEFY